MPFQGRPERQNQRYNDGGGQRCGYHTNGPIGMIGDQAVANRRQPAGTDDARVEQRESTANVTFWRKVRDGSVQYRRGAVEDDPENRKDDQHRHEREDQSRHYQ